MSRSLELAPPRRPGALAAFGRMFAMLLVPAAIVPVILMGPGLLRAPARLTRQAHTAVQRLEIALAPARTHHHPAGRATRMSLHFSARQVSLARAIREGERR